MSGNIGLKGLTAAVAALIALGGPALADMQFGIYGGWNGSFDSDATFKRGNSDFTMHDIPWQGLSFFKDGGAPYYGARATLWPDAMPQWGIMLDYTHAKVRATPSAKVKVTGKYMGGPAPSPSKVSDLFSTFEFTDGINLVTLNAVRQLPPLGAMGKIQPYFGAGIGAAEPHVEVTGPGFPKTFKYEWAGVAAQVLAGINIPITKRFSIFGEYKLSYASVNADLTKGGHVSTNIWTNHVLAGLAVRFGGE
jgi:lipid A oxidase